MLRTRRLGALAAAAALAAVPALGLMTQVAEAAPVTVSVSDELVGVGETSIVTLDGCSVGSTLTLVLNDETPDVLVVAEGDLPMEIPVAYADGTPGEAVIAVTCTPAEGSTEVETTATASLYVLGATWIEADPVEFNAGDTVAITAGDFMPGAAVTLALTPQDSDELLFSQEMGAAGDDFTVSGDVVFPADLECGIYTVSLSDGDYIAEGSLEIRPQAEATPTPAAATETTPGLPSTGN